MKNIFAVISIIFILINSLVGLLFSSYDEFNWIFADLCIIISLVFRWILNQSDASDGMKISFNFILSFFSLLSLVLAIVMPAHAKDNLILVLLIISMSFQFLIAIIPKYFSLLNNKTNKK
jgi:hypothetical protein